VWRGDPGGNPAETRNHERLAPIVTALEMQGFVVVPVLYDDAVEDEVVRLLASLDAALVWVDPISVDGDRTILDRALRAVAAGGTWVSAHPDTILKMGTKQVLYDTRELGWGSDTRLYATTEALRTGLSDALAPGRARVLKQHRGNGGVGVWKVTLIDRDREMVRVQEAAPRDDTTEDLLLADLVDRCAPFLASGAPLIDQPFAARLPEGLIRAYLVEREVVGFARQQPANQSEDPTAPSPTRVLGLPSAKTMYDSRQPEFSTLRVKLEQDWVPALCNLVGVSDHDLPVLWDADFLYGPRADDGSDTYMLCEINVSSVIPFPPDAPGMVAEAVRRRLAIAQP
jgi:hypothetical protein